MTNVSNWSNLRLDAVCLKQAYYVYGFKMPVSVSAF
jgi:hypothetical protein